RGFSAAEVERARNIMEARLLRRTETAEGQANLIADWQAAGDWRLADAYMANVLAVTAEDLQRVARKYLDPAALTLLLYRPESAAEYGRIAPMVHERRFKLPAPAAAGGSDGRRRGDTAPTHGPAERPGTPLQPP